jgi:hypothetical protein
MDTIKSFSVYIDGAKMATAQGHAYDLESNAELQIGDGQVIGISQAVQTGQLVADTIVPFAGAPVLRKLDDAFANNKVVQLSIGILNGQIHKVDAFLTKCQYKSDTVKGTAMGNWTFIFGKPKRSG